MLESSIESSLRDRLSRTQFSAEKIEKIVPVLAKFIEVQVSREVDRALELRHAPKRRQDY